MYCKKCGKELMVSLNFCPECGEPVDKKALYDILNEEPTSEEFFDQPAEVEVKKHVPRCFTVFGNVGYILALVGFVCSFIPVICYMTYQLSLIGLVFSILGKKDPELARKTKKGRIFSILGLIFGFIMMVVTNVLFS